MNNLKDQRGQTIVSVIMIMIIALSVGISVSTRFIKSLRNTSRTDESSRAYAISEALVERILTIDYETLVDYVQFNNCGSSCTLQIIGADGVVSNATATLSFAGGSNSAFPINLKTDEVFEISLLGYPNGTNLNICWNQPISGDLPSITATLIHGLDGNYQADAFSYNSIGSIYSANNFSVATAGYGYDNCAQITGTTNMVALRVRSIYNNIDAYVLPASGVNLPSQGISISSIGTVNETERQVNVILSGPYLPIQFDYVLYSKSFDLPLSN